MDCLQPPLEEYPPGRWHCPLCPPLTEGPNGMEYYSQNFTEEIIDPSPSRPKPSTSKRKGKRKASFTDEDEDVDMDEDDEDDGSSFVAPTAQSRRRRKPSKKGRGRHHDSDDEDEDEEPSSPVVALKRPRIRVTSPVASRPRMVVRLRLPNKGKGYEREEDDGPQKGLFDDILPPDDRDTGKTSVEAGDKHRFEKSRLAAEVRNDLCSLRRS